MRSVDGCLQGSLGISSLQILVQPAGRSWTGSLSAVVCVRLDGTAGWRRRDGTKSLPWPHPLTNAPNE